MADCPKCQSNEQVWLGHVEGWRCWECGGYGDGWVWWLAVMLVALAIVGLVSMDRIAKERVSKAERGLTNDSRY